MASSLKATRPPEEIHRIVHGILTALPGTRARDLAAQFRCSERTVFSIRRGEAHADICPDLPRNVPMPSCDNCRFGTGATRTRHSFEEHVPLCDLGFNDHGGITYAKQCGSYWLDEDRKDG
jgi:hypothetical protein